MSTTSAAAPSKIPAMPTKKPSAVPARPPPPPAVSHQDFDDESDVSIEDTVPVPVAPAPSKKRAAPSDEPSGVASPKKPAPAPRQPVHSEDEGEGDDDEGGIPVPVVNNKSKPKVRGPDGAVINGAATVEGKRSRPTVKRLADEQPTSPRKRPESEKAAAPASAPKPKRTLGKASSAATRAARGTKEHYNTTAHERTLGSTSSGVRYPTPSISWASSVKKGIAQTKQPLPEKLPSSSSCLWIGCRQEGIPIPKKTFDKALTSVEADVRQNMIRCGLFGYNAESYLVDPRNPDGPIVRIATPGMDRIGGVTMSKCEAEFANNPLIRNMHCPTGVLTDLSLEKYVATMMACARAIMAKRDKKTPPKTSFAKEYAELPSEEEFIAAWEKRVGQPQRKSEGESAHVDTSDLYDDADEDDQPDAMDADVDGDADAEDAVQGSQDEEMEDA